MKMFSSSPLEDFQKFSLEITKEIKIIQKQCIDLRIDNSRIQKQLRICVKGIALLVAVPEPDLESEQNGITEDIPEGN